MSQTEPGLNVVTLVSFIVKTLLNRLRVLKCMHGILCTVTLLADIYMLIFSAWVNIVATAKSEVHQKYSEFIYFSCYYTIAVLSLIKNVLITNISVKARTTCNYSVSEELRRVLLPLISYLSKYVHLLTLRGQQ